MEQLSACITERMINLDNISSDDKDCYCYSVQGLLEKVICLTFIVLVAALLLKDASERVNNLSA